MATKLLKIESEKIENGTNFMKGGKIKSWKGDLTSLTNGYSMFANCSNLASFYGDLSSLANGYGMFYYTPLEHFSSNLKNLVNGKSMFTTRPNQYLTE